MVSNTINKELKSVLKEIDQSNGLPNRSYTDNIQYNIEKKLLIFDQWAGVAVSEDIPNVGDAIPITFVGVPLLLLRNEKRHNFDIPVASSFKSSVALLWEQLHYGTFSLQ